MAQTPKPEALCTVEIPESLHKRAKALRSIVDSPYGKPTLKALVAQLLRGAIEQAEKKARA